MHRALGWTGWTVMVGLMVPSVAVAQRAETTPAAGSGFGAAGQIAISSDASASIGYSTAGSDAFFINLNPSVDYFLQQNLSIGAAVLLSRSFNEGPDLTSLGLSVRMGYNHALGEQVSLWPRLSVGIQHSSIGSASGTAFVADAFAPVLLHLVPHFFIGAGPRVSFVAGDGSGVSISIDTTLGGYF
ncbi:hypothetical protein JQX13_28280 [Archangium violaceum]|uniref:hypothetical protein n=1 Tax=Archangium violaceum TaxID=83451 RepID=UPI00193C5AAD|nr:hypothetical protein [Archangium violaceum]QRK04168.1 hypothetical protein JQX13_28280 [Archangium violaceum]